MISVGAQSYLRRARRPRLHLQCQGTVDTSPGNSAQISPVFLCPGTPRWQLALLSSQLSLTALLLRRRRRHHYGRSFGSTLGDFDRLKGVENKGEELKETDPRPAQRADITTSPRLAHIPGYTGYLPGLDAGIGNRFGSRTQKDMLTEAREHLASVRGETKFMPMDAIHKAMGSPRLSNPPQPPRVAPLGSEEQKTESHIPGCMITLPPFIIHHSCVCTGVPYILEYKSGLLLACDMQIPDTSLVRSTCTENRKARSPRSCGVHARKVLPIAAPSLCPSGSRECSSEKH